MNFRGYQFCGPGFAFDWEMPPMRVFWRGWRRFPRREEYLKMLEEYKKELEEELRQVEQEIQEWKKATA
jgi:Ni,Fe-hydrogenase maturation factor